MVWSLSARKAPIQPAQPSEHLLLLYLKVDKVVTGEVVEVLVAWYHVVAITQIDYPTLTPLLRQAPYIPPASGLRIQDLKS